MYYIIKRDGRKMPFNKIKIVKAAESAFIEKDGELTPYAVDKCEKIADYIENKVKRENLELSVEEIQDLVQNGLMNTKRKDVAAAFITYRNERTRQRGNIIDKNINEIVDGKSAYWNGENSNKNSETVTTQRDYMAGEVSTDKTFRELLPRDISDAHAQGIIHFHDADYFAQKALTNCELVDLEDMLQNGTIMNGVMIDKPHRFITASTISTQIILGVTSSTYGGCTISLTHLAPFVRDSFWIYLKEGFYWIGGKSKSEADSIVEEYKEAGLDINLTEEIRNEIGRVYDYAYEKTLKEVKDGVQTFNYQVNSMTNTNGQAPFLSVFMYIGETDEYKEELVLIIRQFLLQRILGFKNRDGVYVTPAFPKLLYVLEEDNIREGSKYWDLTVLAAKCTAKRMVPDYISEKKMKELKIDANGNGNCFPCINKTCA